MQNDINVNPIHQFIESVKLAEIGQKKEIKMDIKTARNLALTLGEVFVKLTQNYEDILMQNKNKESEVI
ncbi:hypothetical protein EBU71_11430, partial [bacterium]|nr:hypothetical protein [Candidatus Elulimicrobium humile]